MINTNNAIYEIKNTRFIRYCTVFPERGHSYPMHLHEDIEIVIAREGCCRYLIDFKEYIVKAGDVLVIAPSSLHAFEQYENEIYRADTFVYNLSMLNNDTNDYCSKEFFAPLIAGTKIIGPHITPYTKGYGKIKENLDNTIACTNSYEPCSELMLKSILFEFYYLCAVNRLMTPHDKSEFSGNYIGDVITYIRNNYNAHITLDMLADSAGISACHLAKLFKRATGMTCIEYLVDYRLTKAYDLILDTDDSILNISINNGFNNISYFNRAFKKKYACTPSELRKNSKTQNFRSLSMIHQRTDK